MISEMDAGLASAGTSSLLMIPTHLTTAPTGRETGSFLALDLGGTNFRVLKVVNLDTRIDTTHPFYLSSHSQNHP
jgi:hexokinase